MSILTGEQLVNAHVKSERELPVIGLKEFEPTNSWLQNKQIQSALYERKVLLEEERVEKKGSLSTAVWKPDICQAEILKKTGKHWDVFGHHKDNADWLYPEEALFLMEMNCLELFFEDVPMSIQRGYTVLINSKTGCSLSEYRVFVHLSRQGFRIFRHDPDITVTAYEKQINLDKYVLNQKTQKENLQNSVTQVDEIWISDNSVENEIEEILPNEKLVNEKKLEEKDPCVIQIDDSDEDIMTVETSQVNAEENSESDSDSNKANSISSSSSSGGSIVDWKRQPVSQNQDRINLPVVRVNYVTVNEFLFDVDKIHNSVPYGISDVEKELNKFYNEIEVIDLAPEGDKRLIISKSRRDILDTLHLMNDSDGNVVIARPDERLLPSGVKPKFPLYRINIESIKSETQKRMPYVNPRPFRGRYNSNYYRNRNYNPWNAWTNNNRGTPVNQMIQLQTMARSVMQMASAVLINTMAPQFQLNWQPRFQNQIRPVHQQSNYSHSSYPLIYDYRQNSNYQQNSNSPFQNNSNFNTMRVTNFSSMNRNQFGEQSLEILGGNSPLYERDYNSAVRNFPVGNRNFNSSNNYERNIYSPTTNYERKHSRPNYQRFQEIRSDFDSGDYNSFNRRTNNENLSNTSRICEIQVDTIKVPPRLDIPNEPNNRQKSSTVSDDGSSDPAYTRSDIPASNDFIPFKSNDSDVVIIEESAVSNEYQIERGGKRKFNPNNRYFHLPSKKQKRQQKLRRKRFRMKFKSKDVEVINLEDDSNDSIENLVVKQECQKGNGDITMPSGIVTKESSLSIKNEKVVNHTVENASSQLVSIPVKNIKTESVNSPPAALRDMDSSQSLTESCPIKTEKADNIPDVTSEKEAEKRILDTDKDIDNVKKEKLDDSEINSTVNTLLSEREIVDVLKVKSEKLDVVKEVTGSNEVTHDVSNVKVEHDLIPVKEESLFNDSREDSVNNCIVKTENSNLIQPDSMPMEIVETINDETHNDDKNSEIERLNGGISEMDVLGSDETQLQEKTKGANVVDKMQMDVVEEEFQKENTQDFENRDNISEENTAREIVNSLLDAVEISANIPTVKNLENDILEDNNVTCNNEHISCWAELKKEVSTLMRYEERDNYIEEYNESDVQPLLKPQHCKTVGSVLSALQIFKSASPSVIEADKLKIMFDLYLPSVSFRKTSRGLPAYRIVVIEHASPIPSPGQIMELKNRFQDDTKVLLAIVMPDTTAYYILAPVVLPTQQ